MLRRFEMKITIDELKRILLPNEHFSLHVFSWAENIFSDDLFFREKIYCPQNIKGAVLKRRREYFYGRLCARAAIREIKPGFNGIIGTNEDRSPEWPSDIVGSISHCDDFAVCVCSSTNHSLAVGVDVEYIMSEEVANNIASNLIRENELGIESIADWSFEAKLTLAFSAKESLYKALSPLVRNFFGFESAELVSIDPNKNSFIVRLTMDLNMDWQKGMIFEGRFIILSKANSTDKIITTLVV